MTRKEIAYYGMGETETSLSIEMEWLEAEIGVRHVLFQVRCRLSGFCTASKERSGLESDVIIYNEIER